MKFKYHQHNLPHPFVKNKKILRPIIPVSIAHKDHSFYFEALIDSGSDFNIFPKELAEKLGIKLQNKRKIYFSGIESDLNEGFIAFADLGIGNFTINTKIIFSDAVASPGILGQFGFFDKFVVKFDLNKKEIELKSKN